MPECRTRSAAVFRFFRSAGGCLVQKQQVDEPEVCHRRRYQRLPGEARERAHIETKAERERERESERVMSRYVMQTERT